MFHAYNKNRHSGAAKEVEFSINGRAVKSVRIDAEGFDSETASHYEKEYMVISFSDGGTREFKEYQYC